MWYCQPKHSTQSLIWAKEMRNPEPAETSCVLWLSTIKHFKMAADLDSMIRTIRITFNDVDLENRFSFKDEVKNALHLLVEKHRVGAG